MSHSSNISKKYQESILRLEGTLNRLIEFDISQMNPISGYYLYSIPHYDFLHGSIVNDSATQVVTNPYKHNNSGMIEPGYGVKSDGHMISILFKCKPKGKRLP
ncbi:MAG: hypothetical protein EXX96DRAFT_543788 [Benjaminiella poitrasii]|nr:MAG: hypothetical protein EXX96DRAFT_543788 [Benjaminiella poitrasii]